MKKMWFLIAGFMMGVPLRSSAAAAPAETPPKVEESTQDADKAAVHDAASEADQWAAKHKAEAVPPTPPTTVTPAQPSSPQPAQVEAAKPAQAEPPKPAPAETPKPAAPPAARQSGLNEMKGKFQSKSYDPKTLRLIVDGGYNVEFSFDSKTTMVNGGSTISIEDLEYNDEVVVRYSGKEMYAVEIDRVSKAPRPQ